MFKSFINDFTNINTNILKIINIFFKISLILFAISIYILVLYNIYPFNYEAIELCIFIFKNALNISIYSFLSGFVIDKIKKEIE